MASRPATATYRSVFENREFRVLLAVRLFFGLGFSFEILGLSVLIFTQTGSPLLSAVAFGIGFLPQVVGGALFTSLADSLPPRLVITSGLLIRAFPGLAIGLLPGLPIAVMLAMVFVAATLAPVFSAASSGLLPELLGGDRYVLARSIFSLTSSSTQLLGLGIGGGILAIVPADRLLLVAGSALLLAALTARFGLRRRGARTTTVGGRRVLAATLAGNAALLTDSQVRGLLLAQWLPVWFVTGAESLLVPYVGSLDRPASTASALLAALPIGMLAGDLVVGRWCRPGVRVRLVFPLAMLLGLPLLAFALQPAVLVAGALLVLSGFCFSYTLGIQQAFLDSLPTEFRGQAFGLQTTGLMGGQGLTPPIVGALAAILGVGTAIAAAGAATCITVIALHGTLTRRRSSTRPAKRPGNPEQSTTP